VRKDLLQPKNTVELVTEKSLIAQKVPYLLVTQTETWAGKWECKTPLTSIVPMQAIPLAAFLADQKLR